MIQGRHSTHIWLLNWVGWNNDTSTPHAWKHVFGKFWERLLVYLQLCWCQTDKPAKRLGCNLFGVSGPYFNVCLYLCVCVCVCVCVVPIRAASGVLISCVWGCVCSVSVYVWYHGIVFGHDRTDPQKVSSESPSSWYTACLRQTAFWERDLDSLKSQRISTDENTFEIHTDTHATYLSLLKYTTQSKQLKYQTYVSHFWQKCLNYKMRWDLFCLLKQITWN